MRNAFGKAAAWYLIPAFGSSVLIAGACSDPAANEPLPGNPATGAELYQKLCASCHGKLGEGAGSPRL
ncbi:MAG TPA: c-type cytochrome, partial [Polyangium sp.]|nr:c-type cytochrome [Polyangium sp.]